MINLIMSIYSWFFLFLFLSSSFSLQRGFRFSVVIDGKSDSQKFVERAPVTVSLQHPSGLLSAIDIESPEGLQESGGIKI